MIGFRYKGGKDGTCNENYRVFSHVSLLQNSFKWVFIRFISLLEIDRCSVTFSIVKGLVVILTLFRLGFRLKIQRFWWEDLWAAVALLCTLVSIISAFAISRHSKCFHFPKPEVDAKYWLSGPKSSSWVKYPSHRWQDHCIHVHNCRMVCMFILHITLVATFR